MDTSEKLMKKLENHLRSTARQLLKFDTTEEVLQYLTDSFQSELNCDFVGVIFKKGSELVSKAWSGHSQSVREALPLKLDQCSMKLFQKSITSLDEEAGEASAFFELLNKESVTWFTMPIIDETESYGFCVIGYLEHIPLFEMYETFNEFGKDVASALSLTKSKEMARKKMAGVEWIRKNLSYDESLEPLVEKIVDMAGKQTNATFASIYLYNEENGYFSLQPPAYGHSTMPKKIIIGEDYLLKHYFPFIEKIGGSQLTVPLFIDLKMIGVLHVENKDDGLFNEEDLEILNLFSNHVSTMLKNVLHNDQEKEQNQRLRLLLDYQQALVTATVEQENFDGITSIVGDIFSKTVMLFDRFMRPLSYKLVLEDELDPDSVAKVALEEVNKRKHKNITFSLKAEKEREITVWPVNGGGDLLGYLVIALPLEEMDNLRQLTINLVRNIMAIQFIKQKLVLNAKEQVKDSFINKLLVKQIEDKEDIIEYANLFQWDLFKPHRVAVVSVRLDEQDSKDILVQKERKTFILDNLKTRISMYVRDSVMAVVKEELILIVPAKEENRRKWHWEDLYKQMKKWMKSDRVSCQIHVGVGGEANSIEDYYHCYRKARETLNVISKRYDQIGYAFYEELGSYTLLHHLKEISETSLYINNYLERLRHYSEGKSNDLFHTLRVYLEQNGNAKNTAEELFIHRSTLLYRLEKIEEILGTSLNNAELRFNLMLAYKLDDLSSGIHGSNK